MHFCLHLTAHCAEQIVSACLRAGSVSAEMVGQGGWVGVGQWVDDVTRMQMVAVRLGCKSAMVGSG